MSGGVLGINPLFGSPFQRRIGSGCPTGQAIRAVNADGSVVCQAGSNSGGTVTSLSAGAGILLSPNPLTTAGTISADTSALQARISSACPAGTAISAVAQSGATSCPSFVPAGEIISTPELLLNSNQGPIIANSGPFTVAVACNTGGGSSVSIQAYSSEANSVADVNTAPGMTFGGGPQGQPAAILDQTFTPDHFFSLQYTLAAPSGAKLSGIISDGYQVLGAACVASLTGIS